MNPFNFQHAKYKLEKSFNYYFYIENDVRGSCWNVILVLSRKSGRFIRFQARVMFYFENTGLLHWRNPEVSIFYFAYLISMLTSAPQIKGEQSENCIRLVQRPVELWRTQMLVLLVYLIPILVLTKAPMSEENEKPVW